jgi:hypothetical protein
VQGFSQGQRCRKPDSFAKLRLTTMSLQGGRRICPILGWVCLSSPEVMSARPTEEPKGTKAVRGPLVTLG